MVGSAYQRDTLVSSRQIVEDQRPQQYFWPSKVFTALCFLEFLFDEGVKWCQCSKLNINM